MIYAAYIQTPVFDDEWRWLYFAADHDPLGHIEQLPMVRLDGVVQVYGWAGRQMNEGPHPSR